MHLQAEVAAVHRVEEVEADRELGAEARERLRAEQVDRAAEDEVEGGDLDHAALSLQQQGVLLGYAVEAPRVVVLRGVEADEVLHPLAAPDSGVEERHDAERPVRRILQSLAERGAGDHAGFGGVRMLFGRRDRVAVEHEVDRVEQAALVAVGDAPLHEEAALVLAQVVFRGVVGTPVRGALALAQLDLPAGHVHQHGRCGTVEAWGEEGGTPADHDGGALRDAVGEGVELSGVVEVGEGEVAHHAEDAVVCEVRGDQLLDLGDRAGRGLDVDDGPIRQGVAHRGREGGDVDPRIRIHEQHGGGTGHAGAGLGELGGGGPALGAAEDALARGERHGGLGVVATSGGVPFVHVADRRGHCSSCGVAV
ncbi:MAG: hypothetical protein K0R99_3153 [Microbacterium sp.]|nr:hypothetical protein [Microbacterium sp.]